MPENAKQSHSIMLSVKKLCGNAWLANILLKQPLLIIETIYAGYYRHHVPVLPLLFPWLSTSVLVVAMVSASAIRDICSILVKPGRLE